MTTLVVVRGQKYRPTFGEINGRGITRSFVTLLKVPRNIEPKNGSSQIPHMRVSSAYSERQKKNGREKKKVRYCLHARSCLFIFWSPDGV